MAGPATAGPAPASAMSISAAGCSAVVVRTSSPAMSPGGGCPLTSACAESRPPPFSSTGAFACSCWLQFRCGRDLTAGCADDMAGSASSAGALGALAGGAELLWLMGAALASEMIGPRSCRHGEAPCFFTKMPCSQEEVGEHVANISPRSCKHYNSPQGLPLKLYWPAVHLLVQGSKCF